MKNYAIKLAMLGLMGAIFAIPATSQADGLRVNLFGLHVAIGHDHCAPAVVVVDLWDWRWRRDHGYSDWAWYRDNPGCHEDRAVWLREHDRGAFRGRDGASFRGSDRDRGRDHDDRGRDRDRDHDRR